MPRQTSTKLVTQSAQGRTRPARIMQPGAQHPDELRGDLNPTRRAGQNEGPASKQEEQVARTAYEIKELHRRYRGLADDDLKRIPVLPTGARLDQGSVYLDLNDIGRGEFVATGDMVAGPENYYVPKSQVDYQLWNRLIGVQNEVRLGLASEA